MKFHPIASALLISLLALTGSAHAKGCLKGAALGGVAGHVAGHGVIGAGVGCAVGRHRANKKEKQEATATLASQQRSTANEAVEPAKK